MSLDISLIPQERIKDLVSTLDNIQSNINNIGTDLTNNLVHKSGTETISGLKTFSSALKRSSTINQSTTSGEVEVGSITVYDKDGSPVGLYNTTRTNTTNTNRQRVTNKNVSGANWFDIRVNVNDAGKGWVSTSQGTGITSNGSLSDVSSSTSDTMIPTKGWVNNPNTSTNVVHRSGDETITGNKTFTGTTKILTPTLTKQNTEYEGGQIYFERSDSDVTMGDNNNHPYIDFWSGKFRFIGQSSSQSGSSVNIPFSIDIQNNCLCHGNSMKVMNYVVETYSSGYAWYRKWSDGWCEQGNCFSGDVNGWQNNTVTLLVPYKNVNYHVSITSSWAGNGDGASYYYANNNKTTTSFKANVTNYAAVYGYATWKASGYYA